jgi:hypothetical protein
MKITITIRGGNLVSVQSDRSDLLVELVDYDNDPAGKPVLIDTTFDEAKAYSQYRPNILYSGLVENDERHYDGFCIAWSKEDVILSMSQWFDNEPELTDAEIDTVLKNIHDSHDAEYGISWESFRSEIESIISDRCQHDHVKYGICTRCMKSV